MIAPLRPTPPALQDLVAQARVELEALQAQSAAARQELQRIALRADDLALKIRTSMCATAPLDDDHQLARDVCLQLGYDWKSLTRNCRNMDRVRQRAAVWSVLRDAHGWSYQRIGAAFRRNHGTVIHALKHFAP